MTKSQAAREANQRYSLKNKAKLKETNLQYRLRNPEKCLWRAAKQRATRKQLEFTINVEDIVIPEYCPILGIKLKRAIGTGSLLDTSPSVDRIDNTLGYTKNNIQVISTKANQMKSTANSQELLAFAYWVLENYK